MLAARSRIFTFVFCDALLSLASALSYGQCSVTMITPSAWSMIAREAIDERNWSFRSLHEAIRSASVSAPDACDANQRAREVASGPNACGRLAYKVRAPAGLPSDNSGTDRPDLTPATSARRAQVQPVRGAA